MMRSSVNPALPQPQTGLETPVFPALGRKESRTLQVNLGYRCNQACAHCHVDAGPQRKEEMTRETIDLVLDFLREQRLPALDVTGGAPELNPHFRYLVATAFALGVEIIDRCNLTILEEPEQETLAAFLAAHRVHIVASLPCYSAANVDTQRGHGVFAKSIRGLQALNRLGYGEPASGLRLDLVYNPVSPFLPPPQQTLEATYRRQLGENFDVRFNRLLTLTNMPIARFRHALEREGRLEAYMDLLVHAFQAVNLENVMCRALLSIDWRGYVYDCDFNQMLGIAYGGGSGETHLSALFGRALEGYSIAVGAHCFGCTAGQGSSCGGALNV